MSENRLSKNKNKISNLINHNRNKGRKEERKKKYIYIYISKKINKINEIQSNIYITKK